MILIQYFKKLSITDLSMLIKVILKPNYDVIDSIKQSSTSDPPVWHIQTLQVRLYKSSSSKIIMGMPLRSGTILLFKYSDCTTYVYQNGILTKIIVRLYITIYHHSILYSRGGCHIAYCYAVHLLCQICPAFLQGNLSLVRKTKLWLLF